MSWYTGLMIYTTLWWCTLFTVLPIGVRTPEEAGEDGVPGQASSAPVRPRLLFKAMLTTVIATVLFLVFLFVLRNDGFGIGDYWRQE